MCVYVCVEKERGKERKNEEIQKVSIGNLDQSAWMSVSRVLQKKKKKKKRDNFQPNNCHSKFQRRHYNKYQRGHQNFSNKFRWLNKCSNVRLNQKNSGKMERGNKISSRWGSLLKEKEEWSKENMKGKESNLKKKRKTHNEYMYVWVDACLHPHIHSDTISCMYTQTQQ